MEECFRRSPHAIEPRADVRERGQLETAVAGTVGVRVQRDVGDAVAFADEPVAPGQVLLHHRQHLRALLQQRREFGLARVVGRQPAADETRHRNARLVTVLLEEQPLQRLRAQPGVVGPERGAFGKEAQDRVGLRQSATVIQLQQRYLAVRVFRQVVRCARRAVRAVHVDPAIVATQLVQQQLQLVAVAGGAHAVDGDHGRSPLSCLSSAARCRSLGRPKLSQSRIWSLADGTGTARPFTPTSTSFPGSTGCQRSSA